MKWIDWLVIGIIGVCIYGALHIYRKGNCHCSNQDCHKERR